LEAVTIADLTISIIWFSFFRSPIWLYQFWATDKVRSPLPIALQIAIYCSYQFLRSFRSPIWFYQFSAYLWPDRWSDCITVRKKFTYGPLARGIIILLYDVVPCRTSNMRRSGLAEAGRLWEVIQVAQLSQLPRCMVGQFWPKVEDNILQTV